MKAINMLAVAVMALTIAATPAQAQSRKDKKQAQKEQWERELRQQAEEDELRHQMRMDSLRKVQQREAEIEAEVKEARLRAEEERRATEAEAKARQKRQDEIQDLQGVKFDEPCMDFESTATLIRARGVGEDEEQQASVEAARSAAIEELGSQLSTKVQSLVMNYKKNIRAGKRRESLRRIEGLTMTEVDQATGYRVACRETKLFYEDGKPLYKTFMVIELGEDMLLKPIYDGIQKDEELKVDADYKSFKKDFDEHFKNKSQEALEQALKEAEAAE